MSLQTRNKKKPKRSVVSARYPVKHIRLLDKVARRWGKDRSDVVEQALDRLLVSEGLVRDEAA